MLTTSNLTNLDKAHSLLTEMIEQGETSAVLFTITSVLTFIGSLDISVDSNHFLHTATINLNNLADNFQKRELADDTPFDSGPSSEDWDIADIALNDEAMYD